MTWIISRALFSTPPVFVAIGVGFDVNDRVFRNFIWDYKISLKVKTDWNLLTHSYYGWVIRQ